MHLSNDVEGSLTTNGLCGQNVDLGELLPKLDLQNDIND
jgi:hypothetical protein